MLNVQLTLPRDTFTLDVDVRLPSQGVTAFYGHSGSGKTSLLRCIAGLERPANAFIQYKDVVWQDDNTFVPTHKRALGYVFQEASLFDHLSARQNLHFAQKRAAQASTLSFDGIIELLGIEHLLSRYPAQLSGGERQRVAIARALLVNPSLLLMDEPLASLDNKRKQDILPYLEKLKRELDLPIVYVSHSAEEIARLADYLVVLEAGRVKQMGTLADTLTQIESPLKLGEDAGSVVEAKITERDSRWQLTCISLPGGKLWFRDTGHSVGEQVRVRILARDVSIALEPQANSSILNTLPAQIVDLQTEAHAGLTLVKLKLGDDCILARISSRSAAVLNLAPGQSVWAQIKSAAVIR